MPATPSLRDIFQWEVRTWSRALPMWREHLAEVSQPARALGIGEREGGLSLWLAAEGFEVVCSDLREFPPATHELHARHGVQDRITYAQADATQLPFADDSFDVVMFKSVLGALGERDRQGQALQEIHRVLRPGGVLLFAENLSGTGVHRFLRKRFVAWDHYWRYLNWPADRDLFQPFARVEARTTGLWANLGRSAGQRDLLARLDALWCPLVPASWHTVLYGAARKAGVWKSGAEGTSTADSSG